LIPFIYFYNKDFGLLLWHIQVPMCKHWRVNWWTEMMRICEIFLWWNMYGTFFCVLTGSKIMIVWNGIYVYRIRDQEILRMSYFMIIVTWLCVLQGASNILGSFFSCLPFSASLSRSLIQQAVGGKTQLASLVSCILLLLVLLFIGPFFELLPNVSYMNRSIKFLS
jgi:hypothetical protein